MILADYLHLLRAWRKDYAPHSPEEAFHPRFIEALQKQDQVEYLLDVLLFGETEEKAALITDYGKDVIQLEQRMAELAAAAAVISVPCAAAIFSPRKSRTGIRS